MGLAWNRKNFLVSNWHVMELLRIFEKRKGRGMTTHEVMVFFGHNNNWPMARKLERLNGIGYVNKDPKLPDMKRLHYGKLYSISKKSREFLKRHDIQSFLDPKNPLLDRTKKIAEIRGKIFIDIMEGYELP